MFPDSDPALTSVASLATDAPPTLLDASLRVGMIVLLLACGGWGWFYWLKRTRGSTRRLEIQERAFLNRSSGVALLRVDDRRMLVGISADGVRLIRELDREPQPSFAGVLAQVSDEEAAG